MNKKKVVKTLVGTIRIQAKDLKVYEKTAQSWKRSKKDLSGIIEIVKLYRACHNFEILIDTKNPRFLKGQLSPRGEMQGARLNVMPDSHPLDKAFSLFAKNLTVRDEHSDDYWDVLYQNKGGTYAYCYTIEKRKINCNKKYRKVQEFDKVYDSLHRKVSLALNNHDDHLALPMYTLLKTYMRIGNEIYYNTNGHKGLTTLKKKNIHINGNQVTFDYIAKDGVPNTITKKFPQIYIKRLQKLLKNINPDSFVFTNPNSGRPLREKHFKKAFRQYCGKEFYPHIVRSHYATVKVKDFLNERKEATKDEVSTLLISLAEKLGHKRFNKKENEWKNSYTVTMNHYVQPKLIEKLRLITIKK